MKLENVLGVRCGKLLPGMFRSERVVTLRGNDYFVCNSNLVIRDDLAYLKIAGIWETEGGYVVRASVDDNAHDLFVEEKDLVFKS